MYSLTREVHTLAWLLTVQYKDVTAEIRYVMNAPGCWMGFISVTSDILSSNNFNAQTFGLKEADEKMLTVHLETSSM